MKLTEIQIENYRSIEKVCFPINKINESYTYGLIGINESGKSSFLQGISLMSNNNINHPLDYFNQTEKVCVNFLYELLPKDNQYLNDLLVKEKKFPEDLVKKIKIESLVYSSVFEPDNGHSKSFLTDIKFKTSIFEDYTTINGIPIKKNEMESGKDFLDFDLEHFYHTTLNGIFNSLIHKIIFWKSSPEYLILEDIDLSQFAINPTGVSIPLMNCFLLSGISLEEFGATINGLTNASAINNLQSKLSELVTNHINSVWPEHPVSIKFQITGNKISLLIEDNGVKFNAKTTGQRSDGFRQFVSFLLTLSAENYSDKLSNTILLIDEPEVHLHPPAQLNLLNELIKITKNKRNNIVFFATHSNYLIDKKNIERNFKVIKQDNHKTQINQIPGGSSSYAQVNYDVFDIATSDFHNELYGKLEATKKAALNTLTKDKKWKNSKSGIEEDVSLATYIRHSIHHPENTQNSPFTEKQLKESIEILKNLL